jgi:hypothetical protein
MRLSAGTQAEEYNGDFRLSLAGALLIGPGCAAVGSYERMFVPT